MTLQVVPFQGFCGINSKIFWLQVVPLLRGPLNIHVNVRYRFIIFFAKKNHEVSCMSSTSCPKKAIGPVWESATLFPKMVQVQHRFGTFWPFWGSKVSCKITSRFAFFGHGPWGLMQGSALFCPNLEVFLKIFGGSLHRASREGQLPSNRWKGPVPFQHLELNWLRSHTKSGTPGGSMSDTAIQHKRVKMGMSDTEISTFWGAKIQHFWASQEYNIYMHIQGSCQHSLPCPSAGSLPSIMHMVLMCISPLFAGECC